MNTEEDLERTHLMLKSVDPQMRILARQLRRNKRIQRADAKKEKGNKYNILELEFPEDILLLKEIPVSAEVCTEIEDSESKLKTQLHQSTLQLLKLLSNGTQIVTNVQVANDARELARKENEMQKRNNQLKKLEAAATVSLEKFNRIADKWKNIVASNDPLDLHYSLLEQTKECSELIEQKNLLAEELRHELVIADKQFIKDNVIQKEDLRILTERINNQILVMKRAYEQELKLIEGAIGMEHKKLQELQNKKWNFLYKQQDRTERTNLDQKLETMEKQEEDVETIYKVYEETFRATKIQLETDVQILQQELSCTRPMCIYSSEKLVYNYQVLKKRSEESIIMQAEQKRMLTKLHDMANNLTKTTVAMERAMDVQIMQLQEELLKLQKKTSATELKADHFMKCNDRQYRQIWSLNENNAKKMLKKLLHIDRIIHEQQLGLEWVPPEKQLMPLPEFLSCYYSSIFLKEQVLEKEKLSNNIRESQPETEKSVSLSRRILNQILALLADSSGFLMSNRLKDILKPYTKSDESLIKIQNIFTALGLQKEEDIQLLQNFFIPYAVCQICDEKQTISEYEDQQNVMDTEADTLAFSKTKNCLDAHALSINPAYVFIALNRFVNSFATLQTGKSTTVLPQKSKTLSQTLNAKDVVKSWAKFQDIFPLECDKLWDGIIQGLQKYLHILQNRHEMNKEVEKLQIQNNELKKLLQNYIHLGSSENLQSKMVSYLQREKFHS